MIPHQNECLPNDYDYAQTRPNWSEKKLPASYCQNISNIYFFFFVALSLVNTCKDGWISFRGSCYLFIDDSFEHWPSAMQHCASHGAHLASIETSDKDTFIRGVSNRLFKCNWNYSTSFWIGGTDDAIEGIWTWHDTNKPLTYFDWSPGQPQNRTSEDCLCLFGLHDFRWDDAHCATEMFHFICEQSENVELIG